MKTYEEDLQLLLKQDISWEKLSGKTVMISGAIGMIGAGTQLYSYPYAPDAAKQSRIIWHLFCSRPQELVVQ